MIDPLMWYQKSSWIEIISGVSSNLIFLMLIFLIFPKKFCYLLWHECFKKRKKISWKCTKVHIFWEGHEIWKNLLPSFESYLVKSKLSGRFLQFFVAFSENLNFTIEIRILLQNGFCHFMTKERVWLRSVVSS